MLKHWIKVNSPTLLAVGASLTIVGVAVSATRDTLKAEEILKKEKVDTSDKKTVVKTVWKCYIPTASMCTIAITSVILGTKISSNRVLAAQALANLTSESFDLYKEKVREQVSKKKAEDIDEEYKKEKMNNPSTQVVYASGESTIYDTTSGRYFKGNIDDIRKIENDLNHKILSDMYISLNDLYYELGLPPTKIGSDLGWNIDNLIEFEYSTHLNPQGEPTLVLDYKVTPMYNYDEHIRS